MFAVEPTVILLRTKKGAGPAVAAVDESDWWDVLIGTSAASDSVWRDKASEIERCRITSSSAGSGWGLRA